MYYILCSYHYIGAFINFNFEVNDKTTDVNNLKCACNSTDIINIISRDLETMGYNSFLFIVENIAGWR